MDLLLLDSFVRALFCLAVLWMLFDAVRRGRGWVRWQVLLYFLGFVAVPIWLFRRRRWPKIVELNRGQQLKFTALAAGIVAANFTLGPAVRDHFFQFARVEGQAMSPTLNNQDRLIVNKRVYHTGDPAIGDIVMLRYPLNPEKTFVKRVIASDGDEVRILNGVVWRNGVKVDESYVLDEYRSYDDWGPEVVPEGTYFVLGDHRNNSSDSREWGFVPREYMLGRVTTRWWPLTESRRF